MESIEKAMMSYGTSRARYMEAEVAGRQKEWLVPLLYEHLLSNLRRASAQIQGGNLEGKSASLEAASSIILELSLTLDTERGGEIATRLSALYAFLAGELLEVGRSLDTAKLDRLVGILEQLHEAWVVAAEATSPRNRPGAAELSSQKM